ncbi:MAG TPA: DUF58 domain-containing protein [Planctomycetaceae bacterium]|nr:DUF58 domain-containing protein [Planctomycetaceae bacterium]
MRHDPDVQRAVNSYQMGLLRVPMAGRSGELLGRGTGSSLEFQEYREYMPGDDIRHLDWSAYGRSDQLMIRLFREEISPRTEILLDGSRSMKTGGNAKPLLAKQITAMFGLMAGLLGGRPAMFLIDDRSLLESLTIEGLDRLKNYSFNGVRDLGDAVSAGAVPLKKQSVRIVISDFLFPHDPQTLIRKLASDAAALWVIQILNEFEQNPTALGGRRMVDAETEQETDLIINPQRIADYKTRLHRLQSELGQACRRAHAPFLTVLAEKGLLNVCHEDFCQAGILRVD